jgi:outer membrane protein
VKNLNILTQGILAIAVIVLFILHFSSKTPKTKQIDQQTSAYTYDSTQSSGPRIAYVNTDTILANYKYYEDEIAQYMRDKSATEKRYMDKLKALEEEYNNYIYKVRLGLITEQQAETEFAQKREDLEKYEQQASQALMEKQESFSKNLYDSIYNVVNRFNQKLNYTFVIATNASNNALLHSDTNFDLTSLIIEELNSNYEAYLEKKKKK